MGSVLEKRRNRLFLSTLSNQIVIRVPCGVNSIMLSARGGGGGGGGERFSGPGTLTSSVEIHRQRR